MVPVDRPGMDLDDPDPRPRRHPSTNVTLRLGRLALRVRGENEVHLLDAGKEPPARCLYHLHARAADMLKQLTKTVLETALNVELTQHLAMRNMAWPGASRGMSATGPAKDGADGDQRRDRH